MNIFTYINSFVVEKKRENRVNEINQAYLVTLNLLKNFQREYSLGNIFES